MSVAVLAASGNCRRAMYIWKRYLASCNTSIGIYTSNALYNCSIHVYIAPSDETNKQTHIYNRRVGHRVPSLENWGSGLKIFCGMLTHVRIYMYMTVVVHVSCTVYVCMYANLWHLVNLPYEVIYQSLGNGIFASL